MKKVYLIRHGLPDFPGGKRMCLGTTDLPLCAEGLAQAENMAARLPPVTEVFSSPLTRAVETARAIGLPVTVLPELREMYAGRWDGLTFQEIRLRYPELYAARGSDPSLPLPDAEDEQSALARFRSGMDAAAGQARGDFAVVTHGGSTARLLAGPGGRGRKPGYRETIPLVWEKATFFLQEEPQIRNFL